MAEQGARIVSERICNQCEIVTCPECESALGVADARVWRVEHQVDGSHLAITVEIEGHDD